MHPNPICPALRGCTAVLAAALLACSPQAELLEPDEFLYGEQDIIGGTRVESGAGFMAAVLFEVRDNGMGFWGLSCGGSIVGASWVLTAAHCVMKRTGEVLPPDRFAVVHRDLNIANVRPEDRVGVDRIVVHPRGRDLAMLRLRLPVNPERRIPIDDGGLVTDGLRSRVFGWGVTQQSEFVWPPPDSARSFSTLWQDPTERMYVAPSQLGGSDALRSVPLSVLRAAPCNNMYTGGLAANGTSAAELGLPDPIIGPTLICGQPTGDFAADACQGDSGGPLLAYDPARGRSVQIGVVSGGLGCGDAEFPGAYERLDTAVEWIRNVRGVDN